MNAFAKLPDISQVKPRTATDDALFAELARVLDKHGALDRFGLTLLHTHFPIVNGELLLEQTDVEARVQTTVPIASRPSNTVETAWRLGPNGQAIVSCICPEDLRGNHMGTHIRHGG